MPVSDLFSDHSPHIVHLYYAPQMVGYQEPLLPLLHGNTSRNIQPMENRPPPVQDALLFSDDGHANDTPFSVLRKEMKPPPSARSQTHTPLLHAGSVMAPDLPLPTADRQSPSNTTPVLRDPLDNIDSGADEAATPSQHNRNGRGDVFKECAAGADCQLPIMDMTDVELLTFFPKLLCRDELLWRLINKDFGAARICRVIKERRNENPLSNTLGKQINRAGQKMAGGTNGAPNTKWHLTKYREDISAGVVQKPEITDNTFPFAHPKHGEAASDPKLKDLMQGVKKLPQGCDRHWLTEAVEYAHKNGLNDRLSQIGDVLDAMSKTPAGSAALRALSGKNGRPQSKSFYGQSRRGSNMTSNDSLSNPHALGFDTVRMEPQIAHECGGNIFGLPNSLHGEASGPAHMSAPMFLGIPGQSMSPPAGFMSTANTWQTPECQTSSDSHHSFRRDMNQHNMPNNPSIMFQQYPRQQMSNNMFDEGFYGSQELLLAAPSTTHNDFQGSEFPFSGERSVEQAFMDGYFDLGPSHSPQGRHGDTFVNAGDLADLPSGLHNGNLFPQPSYDEGYESNGFQYRPNQGYNGNGF